MSDAWRPAVEEYLGGRRMDRMSDRSEPISHMTESQLIDSIRALLCSAWPEAFTGAVPFGDDLAPLPIDRGRVRAWTTDAIMDGVDFDSHRHAGFVIGRKALAVNLSDCAAMGAKPVAALCNLILNREIASEKVMEILRGAVEIAKRFACPIVGGDINSWGAPTAIAFSVAAESWPGKNLIRRDGMRPGDALFITGLVGGSILGRHLKFEPRVELARRLVERDLPSAMIDISDGLALDISRVAAASGCGIQIEHESLERLVHPDSRELAKTSGKSPISHALEDGEDFELIVAVRPDRASEAEAGFRGELLRLGTAVAAPGVMLCGPDGACDEIVVHGWEHPIGE